MELPPESFVLMINNAASTVHHLIIPGHICQEWLPQLIS